MTKETWVTTVGRVDKPWGFETHFAVVPGKYCGKTLHIREGEALSLQYHERKEETIAVQSASCGSRSACKASRWTASNWVLARPSTFDQARATG